MNLFTLTAETKVLRIIAIILLIGLSGALVSWLVLPLVGCARHSCARSGYNRIPDDQDEAVPATGGQVPENTTARSFRYIVKHLVFSIAPVLLVTPMLAWTLSAAQDKLKRVLADRRKTASHSLHKPFDIN